MFVNIYLPPHLISLRIINRYRISIFITKYTSNRIPMGRSYTTYKDNLIMGSSSQYCHNAFFYAICSYCILVSKRSLQPYKCWHILNIGISPVLTCPQCLFAPNADSFNAGCLFPYLAVLCVCNDFVQNSQHGLNITFWIGLTTQEYFSKAQLMYPRNTTYGQHRNIVLGKPNYLYIVEVYRASKGSC